MGFLGPTPEGLNQAHWDLPAELGRLGTSLRGSLWHVLASPCLKIILILYSRPENLSSFSARVFLAELDCFDCAQTCWCLPLGSMRICLWGSLKVVRYKCDSCKASSLWLFCQMIYWYHLWDFTTWKIIMAPKQVFDHSRVVMRYHFTCDGRGQKAGSENWNQCLTPP